MDALLASMTTDEFDEWEEYYNTEPWGEERGDYRNYLLASAIGLLWGCDSKALKPEMFLIDPTRKPKEQDTDEMAMVMRRVAAAQNAQQPGQVILGERL